MISLVAGRECTPGGQPLPAGLGRFAYHLQAYDQRHGADEESVTFWPEDLFAFVLDLAIVTGVDIQRFARNLTLRGASPEQVVARALVNLAEIERVYNETTGALSETRVPRQFLITLAAALIGMAVGDRNAVGGLAVGALSGIGALFINLLADRYFSEADEPKTDFLEELVIKVLESEGPMSAPQIRAATYIENRLLRSTIRRLLAKHLLERTLSYRSGKSYMYDLAARQR